MLSSHSPLCITQDPNGANGAAHRGYVFLNHNLIETTPQSMAREHPRGDDRAHHIDIDHHRFARLFMSVSSEQWRIPFDCDEHVPR